MKLAILLALPILLIPPAAPAWAQQQDSQPQPLTAPQQQAERPDRPVTDQERQRRQIPQEGASGATETGASGTGQSSATTGTPPSGEATRPQAQPGQR